MRRTTAPVLVLLLAVLAAAPPLGAQATAYVPLDDTAYRDLALLRARGLVGREPVGQRPYTRRQFEVMVREAAAALRDGAAARRHPVAVEEAVARMDARFGTPDPAWGAAVRRFSVVGTWAESPARPIPTSYTDSTRIVGELNPLLDGDLGRVRVDGWTGAAEVALEAVLGGRLVLYAHPRGWMARARTGEGFAPWREDGSVHEAYARLVVGNLFVEAGRNHGLMGQGAEVGPLLSMNARGLDMVRVGNEELIRLPWILDRLGPTRMTFLFADLGSRRVIPNSKVLMGKVSFRPGANLELGMSYLNQQFGEGAPEADIGERLLDMFLPFPFIDFAEISERMYGLDARYRIPERGLELYADVMATDFNGARLHEVLWEEAAWLMGLRFDGLGAEGRLGVEVEAQRNGIRPYTHHHFYSGMTLDGRVLGSPLGPHATSWALRGSWLGTSNRVQAEVGVAWFSGDRYRGNDLDGTKFRWNKVAQREDEVRFRGSVSWRGTGPAGTRPALRAGVERIRNHAFSGSSRWSGMVALGLEVGR